MGEPIRVAVVGYGNVGRFAVDAVLEAPDLQLAGVVRRSGERPPGLDATIPVAKDIAELGDVDVALLCAPTRSVPQLAEEYLARGINTVDSYDIHGELVDVKRRLDEVARRHGAVAIVSAGWDPGTDSMIRGLLELMAPRGMTYTNFGPGMSMGHSVAAKAAPGVKDALSLTVPLGQGLHRRMVYIELEEGASFEQAREFILSDPYFKHDDTRVIPVPSVADLIDMGHGVVIERKGVSGRTHNQLFSYTMRINNPALDLAGDGGFGPGDDAPSAGAYTMLEVPIIDYLPGDRDALLRRLV